MTARVTFAEALAALRAGCGEPSYETMQHGIEWADWHATPDGAGGVSVSFDGDDLMVVALADFCGDSPGDLRFTIVGTPTDDAPLRTLPDAVAAATRWLREGGRV